MRRYEKGNNKLELWGSKASLYKDGVLTFRGDGYIAIKMFIANTNNDPEVMKIFKSQLDMREEVKWKKQDEELRMKEKQKTDEMKEALKPTPKKEIKPKRKQIDRLFR